MPTAIDVKDAAGSTVSVATLDALLARVGEVQASPTSLTLLDRLKSIAAAAAAPVIAAGTNIIGGTQPVSGAAGGASVTRVKSAATINATVVKAAAGTLYSVRVVNLDTASPVYVRLYNKATTPDPSADSALLIDEIYVPAAASATAGSVVVWSGPAVGVAFSTGIGFATATGVADIDETAVAANKVITSVVWK